MWALWWTCDVLLKVLLLSAVSQSDWLSGQPVSNLASLQPGLLTWRLASSKGGIPSRHICLLCFWPLINVAALCSPSYIPFSYVCISAPCPLLSWCCDFYSYFFYLLLNVIAVGKMKGGGLICMSRHIFLHSILVSKSGTRCFSCAAVYRRIKPNAKFDITTLYSQEQSTSY